MSLFIKKGKLLYEFYFNIIGTKMWHATYITCEHKKNLISSEQNKQKVIYSVGCLETVLQMESLFQVAAFIKQMVLWAIGSVIVKQGQSLVFSIRTTISEHLPRIMCVRHYLKKEQQTELLS